ncbi:MAG TPA: hypothetical protein VHX88_12190 [Solirubrobacteraceae bacterium]|nr:hypothetical protein [Solirubrobacteraceae bacterium]
MTDAEIVSRLVRAFNGHDLDGVLALVDEKVELSAEGLDAPESPLAPAIAGRLRAELEGLMRGARFTALGLIEAAGTVLLSGRVEVLGEHGRELTVSLSIGVRRGTIVRVALRVTGERGAAPAEAPALALH